MEPNSFPPVANKWINQYSSANGNFQATQPNTLNLSDWPDPTGKAGRVLTPASGGGYQWVPQSGGGATGFTGYINVKNTGLPSGNALGDGANDDTAAIQGAINAGAGQGLTIYFPAGTYRTTAALSVTTGRATLLGDSPNASVIVPDLLMTPAGAILILTQGSSSLVQRLGFRGGTNGAVSGSLVPIRNAIQANGANQIMIQNCNISACLGSAMKFNFCYDLRIQDCRIFQCGSYGIAMNYCPRAIIRGNVIGNTQQAGIWLVNSHASTVTSNQVIACGPFSYGLGLLDSDNSAITGNLVQQCAVGVHLQTSTTRAVGANWDALNTYGYTFVGNTICRNYYGGVQVMNSHGFKITGNVITDNGQGAADAAHGFTIEPGLMVPIGAFGGSGYQSGDVVTLDPANGAGTPAKAIVCSVNASGRIMPNGLLPITMGNYTTWPTNPVNLTGGSGTGARCYFSGSKIQSGGSGYSVGQAVRHNIAAVGAPFYNPVRALITAVDGGGAVTGYVITDGGGYHNATYSTVAMTGDAFSPADGPIDVLPGNIADPGAGTGAGAGAGFDYPDAPDVGAGFVLSAAWARRYSILFPSGAGTTYNLSTYHTIYGGVICGNAIDHCKSGCAYLNLGTIAPPWGTGVNSDRAYYLIVTGNSIKANGTTFTGGTVGTGGVITLDANYNVPDIVTPYLSSSTFDTVMTISGTTYHAPLNRIGP